MKFRCALLLGALLVPAHGSAADREMQAEEGTARQTMNVPATATGLASLTGLVGRIERGQLMLEVIRKLHETRETSETAPLRLKTYLATVERLQSTWRALDRAAMRLRLGAEERLVLSAGGVDVDSFLRQGGEADICRPTASRLSNRKSSCQVQRPASTARSRESWSRCAAKARRVVHRSLIQLQRVEDSWAITSVTAVR